MKNIYAIDFETFYDKKEYSITIQGVDGYINDPRFDAYLVSVWGEDIQFVGHPRDFDWAKLNKKTLLAHNARFDETVFLKLQEIGVVPKDCIPKDWLCTADMAVYCRAPRSLAGASSALLGEKVDKSTRDKMAKLTYKDACDQGFKEEVDQYALDDARLCYQIFEKAESEWPEFERFISKRNREDSRRGLQVDEKQLDKAIDTVNTVLWEAANKIPWDWSMNKTPLGPTKVRAECRKQDIRCPSSLAEDNEDCQAWEAEFGDEYPWVGAIRDWRKANMLHKKLLTIRNRLTPDGIFPYTIKYGGAHTLRFSGDGGFNMQNMTRLIAMGVDLRGLFIPRPGKRMILADLAQIEARILLYLVGDEITLDLIRGGLSVYEAHAVQTMRWDHDRDGELKKKNPMLYSLAKARVLGLGYGCGHKRFCKQAADLTGGEVILSLAESNKTVKEFRAANPKITNFWRKLQRDMAWSKGGDYEIELPSGRSLKYYNVRSSDNGLSAELVRGGGRREYFYGGKLTENVVQAVARDVFIEGWGCLHSLGYDQLFHVHDEHVIEADDSVKIEDIEHAISIAPSWLEGCPVGAEVKEVERYCK